MSMTGPGAILQVAEGEMDLLGTVPCQEVALQPAPTQNLFLPASTSDYKLPVWLFLISFSFARSPIRRPHPCTLPIIPTTHLCHLRSALSERFTPIDMRAFPLYGEVLLHRP